VFVVSPASVAGAVPPRAPSLNQPTPSTAAQIRLPPRAAEGQRPAGTSRSWPAHARAWNCPTWPNTPS
jgi:hypothetical protein